MKILEPFLGDYVFICTFVKQLENRSMKSFVNIVPQLQHQPQNLMLGEGMYFDDF